jgi:hypothetical protein
VSAHTRKRLSPRMVYSGRVAVGRIEPHGLRWSAVMADGEQLGNFNSDAQAASAVWGVRPAAALGGHS